MSENEWESGEEAIDESGRNPTQQRMRPKPAASRSRPTNSSRGHIEAEEGQDLV